MEHAVSEIHLCVLGAALCMPELISVCIAWAVPSSLASGYLDQSQFCDIMTKGF